MATSTPRLRLWPGLLAAVLCLLRYILPWITPDALLIAVGCGATGTVGVLIWWLFFSRAPVAERWGTAAFVVVWALATTRVLDSSIRGGMMGLMFGILAVPTFAIALVLWAAATREMSGTARRIALAGILLVLSGAWAAIRTEGITGEGKSQLAWRWSKTHEQTLAASPVVEPPAATAAPEPAGAPVEPAPAVERPAMAVKRVIAPEHEPEWPGFRGPQRDSRVSGLKIATDWAASPPKVVWRRDVGPGWSSFAVGDGLLYTQEQRGDFEVVSCYRVATGEPVWAHRDRTRFWESNAGPGPRGTPTLSGGRVFSLGATGTVNALAAADGALLWTRNAASDTGAKLPEWGFASSPLVVGSTVLVAAAGRLAAYDVETGKPRWMGPKIGAGYSSPQVFTFEGKQQIVQMTHAGAMSLSPADGSVLWKHDWAGFAMLQPAIAADGGILITTANNGGGLGTRRLAVTHRPDGWVAEESWTSSGLKPYFNDLVVLGDHAYGFDGSILSCIDLKDGKRKWKGGRYGHGQLVLLADQSVLLVLTEEGELALVSATPDEFREIARAPALEGKTWNHPALSRDLLLVRNGQQIAAFRLARAAD